MCKRTPVATGARRYRAHAVVIIFICMRRAVAVAAGRRVSLQKRRYSVLLRGGVELGAPKKEQVDAYRTAK